MGVFDRLVEAYEQEGVTTASGLNPVYYDDFFLAPLTWLVRDGVSVTDGLGMALQEIYFLECLADARPASRIVVIGNSYGWSTLALALANPGARVVAIDAGLDENSLEGLTVTARMADRLGLDVSAVRATSPDDVAAVLGDTAGQVDLLLVDGFHSNEQLVADWRAVRPFLDPEAIVLAHDVLMLELGEGFRRIVAESGWTGVVLHGTTTGMALLACRFDPALTRLVTAFAGHPEAREVVAASADPGGLSGTAQREHALAQLAETVRERSGRTVATTPDTEGPR